jgi:transcriptional regulator with XRE-family HTH domain
MTLNEYLCARHLSDGQFAKRIGCARTTVSRWRRGVTRPEWGDLQAIAKATKGAVNPNDFLYEADEASELAAEAAE